MMEEAEEMQNKKQWSNPERGWQDIEVHNLERNWKPEFSRIYLKLGISPRANFWLLMFYVLVFKLPAFHVQNHGFRYLL